MTVRNGRSFVRVGKRCRLCASEFLVQSSDNIAEVIARRAEFQLPESAGGKELVHDLGPAFFEGFGAGLGGPAASLHEVAADFGGGLQVLDQAEQRGFVPSAELSTDRVPGGGFSGWVVHGMRWSKLDALQRRQEFRRHVQGDAARQSGPAANETPSLKRKHHRMHVAAVGNKFL